MKAIELKKALAKLPDDCEVVAYERGNVYETRVKAIEKHPTDKKAVRIIHGNY